MNDPSEDLLDPPADADDSAVPATLGEGAQPDRGGVVVPSLRSMAGPLLGVALVSLGIGFLLARNVGEEPPNAGVASRTVSTPPGPTATTQRPTTTGGGASSGTTVPAATTERSGTTDGTTPTTETTGDGTTAGATRTSPSVPGTAADTTVGTAAPTSAPTSTSAAPTTVTATGTTVTTVTTSSPVTVAPPAPSTVVTTQPQLPTTLRPTTTVRATTTTVRATTTTARPTTTTLAPGTSYRSAVLAASPMAYWSLDDAGGGRGDDRSGSGAGGTYSGAVAARPGALSGGAGAAAAFDAPGGQLEVPDRADLRLNGPFTIELWARLDTFQNTWPGLLHKGPGRGGDTGWLVYYDTSGRVILKRNGTEVPSAAGALRSDRFTHLVVTYDGSTVRWYVDGQPSSSKSVSFPADAGAAPLAIGRGDHFGDHLVDEVAVYPSALPAATVAAHTAAAARA